MEGIVKKAAIPRPSGRCTNGGGTIILGIGGRAGADGGGAHLAPRIGKGRLFFGRWVDGC